MKKLVLVLLLALMTVSVQADQNLGLTTEAWQVIKNLLTVGRLTPGTMAQELQSQPRTFMSSYTWTNAQVVALGAGLTGDITVATFPAKTVVKNAYVVINGAAVTGKYATGTITMSGVSVADQTFTVGAQTFTWKAARTGLGEVTIGASSTAACANIVTALTADLATVTSVCVGSVVTITAAAAGTGGNALALANVNSANLAVSGAGFLAGGEDLTSLTVALGRTSATYLDYIAASDAKAAANTVYGDVVGERGANLTGYDLPSYVAAVAVKIHLVAVGTNLENVVGSTGRVVLETALLP
jgi:hypothetical protein